jgi:hypothetical protein
MCPTSPPTNDSLEALLAYMGSAVPKPGSGEQASLYYEDGTAFCGATLAITKSGSTTPVETLQAGFGSTSSSSDLTVNQLYAATVSPSEPSSSEVSFLKSLSAVDAADGGSAPNAADPLPSPPGENNETAPYVEQITFTVPPENLTPGTYTATFTVYDSDGNYEPYTWSFSVQSAQTPVGTLGGVAAAGLIGGGLVVLQTRRRRRPATSA